MEKREAFTRTNSICLTNEENLLQLVLKNDRRNIVPLVRTYPTLLTHIYGSIYNKPILLIACSEENVEAETVKTLIDLGADLYHSSDLDEGWQALHFAAYNTKSDILRVVVENLNNPGDVNILAKGNSALHVLIRYGKSESTEEFVECAKVLVEEGIDVNQGDRDNISPILWAAKKGYKEIIKVILEHSKIPVDLDSHKSRNKTARDIISDKNLYDGNLPGQTDNNNENEGTILFQYLNASNENAFLNYRNGDIFHLVNENNSSSTLLQVSCEKRLKRAAEHLLDKGANPNLTYKNDLTPIEICAENGSYEIFQILLDQPKVYVPKTVFTTLLKNLDNEELPGISHEKCYNTLLDKVQTNRNLLDINETDESKNSPLHYAVRYSDAEKVEKLLQLGASLGSKNKYGVMPIQDIEPAILEKHLDSCVEFDLKEKRFEKEDFVVTFNYHTLIPPAKKIEYNVGFEKADPETNLHHSITQELVAETEVISYMSKAPEFRHLLKHPVIVSFLFMKWHRIRWLFYTNLAFYIAFFFSLVVYIFEGYVNRNVEYSVFEDIAVNLSKVILIITYFILIFRELFQITVSPEKYFKNFENYLEIVLIIFTGLILFDNSSTDTKKILSSVAILLAAFELVLMVGQHPKLSTNVVMLETVSLNFFKFLMWYSLLIIAFALSFYILFSESEEQKKNTAEDDEKDFFTDPGRSMFKTIVMLTGEFDAGSLNFDHFPITSTLIFALFIFMIAIILLNLLNGLAVNDTQQIKNDAELFGHIARAQHIRYVESMLLGNLLPRTILKKINDLCCCVPKTATSNFTNSKYLAERACLFPHYLDYKLTIYPNKFGQIYLEKHKPTCGKYCIGSCAYLHLDKQTIKRTNKIIQQRRESEKIKQEDNHLQKFENIIKTLVENACKDKAEISLLNNKLDAVIKYLSAKSSE